MILKKIRFLDQFFFGHERQKTKDFERSPLFFVFVSERTQHRLTACGQHHFTQRENIIPLADTKRCFAFVKNDVMLRINDVTPCGVNDVALRAVIWYYAILPVIMGKQT